MATAGNQNSAASQGATSSTQSKPNNATKVKDPEAPQSHDERITVIDIDLNRKYNSVKGTKIYGDSFNDLGRDGESRQPLKEQPHNSLRIFSCPNVKSGESVLEYLSDDKLQFDTPPYSVSQLYRWAALSSQGAESDGWFRYSFTTAHMSPERTRAVVFFSTEHIQLKRCENGQYTLVWTTEESPYKYRPQKVEKTRIDFVNRLNTRSTLCQDDATNDQVFVKLLLLDILKMDVDQFEQFEIQFRDLYTRPDTSKSGLWSINNQSDRLLLLGLHPSRPVKRLVEKCEDMKDNLDRKFLEEIVSSAVASLSPAPSYTLQIMRLQSSSFLKQFSRVDATIQDLLSYDTAISTKQQSSSLFILTFITAICLPFSLAASTLSMQYQFHDILPKLRDMVIFAFVLACIMLIFYKGFDLFLHIKRYVFQVRFIRTRFYRTLLPLVFIGCCISFLAQYINILRNDPSTIGNGLLVSYCLMFFGYMIFLVVGLDVIYLLLHAWFTYRSRNRPED
ncbi:hypothetical protein BU24DRAFT_423290 [Aaosphaeria arxii CBS 175.79]|uniref:Uncharacterized protein n=1 Tax=Aaosphaeria arxii CBS 175.79 TaxID=1450172 RepID=A0A6A5XM18_9PLEO|nr:uncharacterized protein BU24DRAFT_423290 [Aaosphaeria arxii CBS 175.79]KAF2014298.1 hypothetical protein BU24DRAFT_423290 [Aaosphaeria arxii CBS 175.79]